MDDRFATQFSAAHDCATRDTELVTSPSRYLIMLSGGIPGTMIPLSPGILWLGRSEDNAITLSDPSVSRRHAGLRVDEAGGVWLTDQASTNGSFRNGHRLAPYEPTRILDGDRIRLGSRVVLKYSCPDVEEEQFQKAMFERTVRDSLTGLYNRSYFLDQLRSLAGRASGRGLGLAIFMLDIDHFKNINDRLGHPAGDVVLREVALLLRQATRSEDLIARYGGEEFAICMPASSHHVATDRAERVRSSVERAIMDVEGESVRVTVSLGVAFSQPTSVRDFAHLITAADRSLYQAKNGGRNRVVCLLDAAIATPRSWAISDL